MEKELVVRINPDTSHSTCFAYNFLTHHILLPNVSNKRVVEDGFNRRMVEKDFDFTLIIESFTHEFIHKWLHENLSAVHCHMWDYLDKDKKQKRLVLSSL